MIKGGGIHRGFAAVGKSALGRGLICPMDPSVIASSKPVLRKTRRFFCRGDNSAAFVGLIHSAT
jgi:hypothetical protein